MSAALRVERFPWAEWAMALTVSLLMNAVGFSVFAVLIALEIVREAVTPAPPPEVVATIHPEQFQVDRDAGEEAAVPKRGFVRTSDDQEQGKSERARFIGERNTTAASDWEPTPDGPDLPSQMGREPRREGELETTRSDYQDGSLDHADPATPATPAARTQPSEETAPEPADLPGVADSPGPVTAELPDPLVAEPAAPERERLAEGPLPVDRPLPPEPREHREELRDAAAAGEAESGSERPPAPAAASDREPGFRGYQRPTRLRGSFSRRGTSSLDVDDTSLGRYQAQLSRAVEREWQRNCVRYRDFITPGFLTVRFLVDADGGIRRIEFLEVVEASEIQKGFTLNSIRNAPIPKMPGDLSRELDGDPLELIYNFYF